MNLIDRLDEYLLDGNRRPRRSHHPSDITSCLRQLYYKWNNYEPTDPPTAGNLIKMRFGDGAEKIIEGWLDYEKRRGDIAEYTPQVEVTGTHPDLGYSIHGYEDFVVQPSSGQPFGLELKSSYGRGIKEIQQAGQPKPEHLWQVYIYMYFNNRPVYYLLYIGRDNGYRTQFELTMKDGVMYVGGREQSIRIGDVVNKLVKAEHTVGAAVPPEQEYIPAIKNGEIKDRVQRSGKAYKSDWQCRYCAYRSMCWAKQLRESSNGRIFYGKEEI